jgi:hypothetical protein
VIPGVGGRLVCACVAEDEHEGGVELLYDISDPGECRRIEAELKARYEDAICDAMEKHSLW